MPITKLTILLLCLSFLSCRGSYDSKGKQIGADPVQVQQQDQKTREMINWQLPLEFARSEVEGCKITLTMPLSAMILNRSDLSSSQMSWIFSWKAEGEKCSGDYILRYQGGQHGGVLRLGSQTSRAFGLFTKTQGVFYWNSKTMEDAPIEPSPEGYLFWNVEDVGTQAQPEPAKVKLL